MSIFIVVDLPQPFEPRKPKISPRAMRKLTSSTAVKLPKRRVRCSASIAGTASSRGGRGFSTTGRCWACFSGGRRAMNAASMSGLAVRSSRSAGLPLAMTWPSSMAISHSKREASSM